MSRDQFCFVAAWVHTGWQHHTWASNGADNFSPFQQKSNYPQQKGQWAKQSWKQRPQGWSEHIGSEKLPGTKAVMFFIQFRARASSGKPRHACQFYPMAGTSSHLSCSIWKASLLPCRWSYIGLMSVLFMSSFLWTRGVGSCHLGATFLSLLWDSCICFRGEYCNSHSK